MGDANPREDFKGTCSAGFPETVDFARQWWQIHPGGAYMWRSPIWSSLALKERDNIIKEVLNDAKDWKCDDDNPPKPPEYGPNMDLDPQELAKLIDAETRSVIQSKADQEPPREAH